MTVTTTAGTRSDYELVVVPFSPTIGAEVRGIDLRQPLDDDLVRAIRRVLLDHKVIFFRDQHLDPHQHREFARYFGELTAAHPVIPGLPGYPEVFEIDYTRARAVVKERDEYNATGWHTDVTFVERPPLGSILNAIVMPPTGGDTLWGDQVAAYEALSPALREFLGGLTGIHSGAHQFAELLAQRDDGGGDWDDAPYRELAPVEHPVVRTHPETGARALFVNRGFTIGIKELRADEARTLLEFLFQHSTRPEFVVRHHWRTGDIAFWDNRVTQHAVVGDFGDRHRVIQRVTLRGDEPR